MQRNFLKDVKNKKNKNNQHRYAKQKADIYKKMQQSSNKSEMRKQHQQKQKHIH